MGQYHLQLTLFKKQKQSWTIPVQIEDWNEARIDCHSIAGQLTSSSVADGVMVNGVALS